MSITPEGLHNLDNLQVPASQVVLVYTEWNEKIIDALKEGALKILSNYSQLKITSYKVPGAVEIPYIIKQHHLRKGNKNTAYIALGCVIRGGTPHFDYVCQSVTNGISHLNVSINSPVIFGILTVDNEEQAWERLGGKHGHKGEEAAITTLKMLALQNQL